MCLQQSFANLFPWPKWVQHFCWQESLQFLPKNTIIPSKFLLFNLVLHRWYLKFQVVPEVNSPCFPFQSFILFFLPLSFRGWFFPIIVWKQFRTLCVSCFCFPPWKTTRKTHRFQCSSVPQDLLQNIALAPPVWWVPELHPTRSQRNSCGKCCKREPSSCKMSRTSLNIRCTGHRFFLHFFGPVAWPQRNGGLVTWGWAGFLRTPCCRVLKGPGGFKGRGCAWGTLRIPRKAWGNFRGITTPRPSRILLPWQFHPPSNLEKPRLRWNQALKIAGFCRNHLQKSKFESGVSRIYSENAIKSLIIVRTTNNNKKYNNNNNNNNNNHTNS